MHTKHGDPENVIPAIRGSPSRTCNASSSSKDTKPVVYAAVVFFRVCFLSFVYILPCLRFIYVFLERGGAGAEGRMCKQTPC